jgi:hypothetical protein
VHECQGMDIGAEGMQDSGQNGSLQYRTVVLLCSLEQESTELDCINSKSLYFWEILVETLELSGI